MDVTPEETLAIILGAHEWPETELTGGPSFLNSARAVRSYLRDEQGFRLPKDHLLDLFGSEDPAPVQIRKIKKFLQAKNKTDIARVHPETRLFDDPDEGNNSRIVTWLR